MSGGDVQAARAFREAGNHRLALEHARKALRDDEDAPAALDIYCDCLLDARDFAALETAAIDWIARDPQDARPYISLLLCYAERKDKKMAATLVSHFRDASPHDAESNRALQALHTLKFGDATEGLSGLAAVFRDEGNGAREKYWQAMSLVSECDFDAAHAAATEALRLGSEEPEACTLVAFTLYNRLRLVAALRYADMALARDPQHMEARELRLWIMLAFFPPFLLGLALYRAIMAPTPTSLSYWRNQVELWLLIGLPGMLALAAQRHWHVAIVWPLAAMVIAFVLAQPMFGRIARLLSRRRKAPVQLKPF
jgi:tetratricopeptide (TPR) repeat protein